RSGPEMLGVAEIDQRVETIGAFGDDIAAAAAIAPVGPAEFHKLLAQEADGASTAGPGFDIDLGLVEEFHCCRAFQTLRVSLVSICSSSAPRARQSRVDRPISVKPSRVWMASEVRLK